MCTELDNLIDCVKEAESSLYSKVPQSEIENMKDRIRELEIIEDRAEKVHKASIGDFDILDHLISYYMYKLGNNYP